MRDQELVNALRCVSTAGGPMGDCKKCPFYKTEPVPEDLAGKVNLTELASCDVDAVGLAAADQLENQSAHIAALQKEIEKLRGQVPQWIPVAERLPEDPVKKVLVFVPHTHGNIVDSGRYLGSDGWVLEGWYLTQTAVTHWMPLPEPPEVK